MTAAQLVHSYCCPILVMERNTLQKSRRSVPPRLHPRGRACCLFLKLYPSLHGFGPGYCPCIHITSWDHTHTSLLVGPVSINCQETLHIMYNVHKTTSLEIRHKKGWKIHIYIALLERNGHKWSLETKETRLKPRRTRELGSPSVPVWGSGRCTGEVWAGGEGARSLLLPQLQSKLFSLFCYTCLFQSKSC